MGWCYNLCTCTDYEYQELKHRNSSTEMSEGANAGGLGGHHLVIFITPGEE